MSDLAELTGFAQRYAEAWCPLVTGHLSLVTSLISSYELWEIDNGAGGSRTTWTGGPGSRPGWSADGEQGGESINDGLIAESKGHFDSAEYERQLKHGVDG